MMPAQQPFWNILSVALPLVAFVVGCLLVAGGGGAGDYAGRLGAGILFALGMGAVCGLGAAAAVVALFRGEARVWLSVLGLAGNLAVALPVVGVLLRR